MGLEQRLWRETEKNLNTTLSAANDGATLSFQTLSSLRSLITNPTTSDSTIAAVVQTITTALSLSLHPLTHLHLLSLLSTLSLHRPSLSSALIPTATSLLTSPSPRIAAAALSLLRSIPAANFSAVDDELLISICFHPCVAVRVWFLRNALRFEIGANLLVTVFLGFTKDPYPNVRQAALIALSRVCEAGVVIEDSDIVEACYFRAVELLRDQEDYVRQAAVRAAGEWGRMFASLQQEGLQKDWFDAVFLQICSAVRDMNVPVRVEAYIALGKFNFVSEDILLQSLSKKVLKTVKEKQSLSLRCARQYKIHADISAGAFIHGLEDESSEVQLAACITLRMLSLVPGQFAGEAVNILSYVLNDDSIIVRSEALNTLHHMATSGSLKLQEEHIDMLLGTVVDSYQQIRSRAISIVGSVKLPALKLCKLAVESLLGSLDMHPKSEAEIFRALVNMGQNNAHHSVSIIKDFYHEVEPSGDGKFGCNNHRVAGLMVLAVSASLKQESCRRQIPQKLFAYAAAFFGWISYAFVDILDAHSLLQYLSHCGNWFPEAQPESTAQPPALSVAKDHVQTTVHVLDSVKLILGTVKSFWDLVKSGCTSDVLRALRCCKGSLRTLRADSSKFAGAIAFAVQYIRIVKLISRIWEHFVVARKCNLYRVGELDILLAKLDKVLLALRFRFSGLGQETELYILELQLLSYVLTLSSFRVDCRILRKLSTTIAYMDELRTFTSATCSDFMNQLSHLCSIGSLCYDKTLGDPSDDLKKLRDLFILKDLTVTQSIRQVYAELVASGYDSVTPLRFIPGLPVGVPLEITLYNVTSEQNLWLKLSTVDELTEFVFLDMEELGDLPEVRQVQFTSPFYRTPKAVAFTLKVSIGIECKSEILHLAKCQGGAKHTLTYISPEMELYFVNE